MPFKAGDLVYLSSKNISFKKGLARKLLPKFLGPYKIIKEFGNASFLLELPAHLKRRGVHDIFHSSLLKIHVPSDDRLFPGRMDTQIVDTDEDDEWAVDRILSHHGSRVDASFEILWKSGDVTWLPYYQITYLQALTDYLGLLNVSKIAKLPAGHGRPPLDDPQVSLGFIIPKSPQNSCSSFSSSFFGFISSILNPPFRLLTSQFRSLFQPAFVSPTIDIEVSLTMPPPSRLNHPYFKRLSATHYEIQSANPNDCYTSTVHVGQIADFLSFDEHLRECKSLLNIGSIPLGYLDFSDLWNNGVSDVSLHRGLQCPYDGNF